MQTATIAMTTSFRPTKRMQRFMKTKITPEVAQYLLDTFNTRNRSLTDSTVEAYARDMSSGRWFYTGEAIKFSADGVLTNGQHRLKACVVSGTSFFTDVLVGMSPDSVLTEDTGKSRSVADVVSIATGTRETLSVPRLRSVRNAILRRRTRLTVSDFSDLKADFSMGIKAINSALTMRTGLGRAPVAAALVIAAQTHPSQILRMVDRVLSGTVETNAERLLHRYVFVSNTIEPEDVTTQKVLFACLLQVQGGGSSEKRLLSNSNALKFFLGNAKERGSKIAKLYFEINAEGEVNSDEVVIATPTKTAGGKSQLVLTADVPQPAKSVIRRDARV